MPIQAQSGGRNIAPPIRYLGLRRGWVVSTTPQPLYPRERPGTVWTVTQNLAATWIRHQERY